LIKIFERGVGYFNTVLAGVRSDGPQVSAQSRQAAPTQPPGGSLPWKHAMNFAFAFSLALILVAVIGVFCFIPFVSDFAFWFSAAAYVVLASTHH
jgi:hypothetical protein